MRESRVATSGLASSNLASSVFHRRRAASAVSRVVDLITVAVLRAVVYDPSVVYDDTRGVLERLPAARGPRRPQQRRQAGVARGSHNLYLRAATG